MAERCDAASRKPRLAKERSNLMRPRSAMRNEADSESVYLSDHASALASARASGPGSSRMGRWINAANRPSTTAAHHIGV